MDLVKISNDFDPTPKLKSSPIPINFIPFHNYKNDRCIFCGEYYKRVTFSSWQKYCKNCLSCYLINITDNNMYLDAYYTMMDLECSEHEIRTKEPQVIQECCRNCLKVLCFKQTLNYFIHSDFSNNNVIEIEYCKLCGKSLYQENDSSFMIKVKLCSDCYLISSEYIESTLTKKLILIINLPWWHNISYCNACEKPLTFTSDCQKYCKKCLIFYTGCRYCLTTNIIFGLTAQSQCKKCKRISSIISDFTNIINFLNENSELDEFSRCGACDKFLTLISEYQKYCENCFILYIKCKYCLAINLILGLINQFQCRKCNRASIVNIFSGNSELDEFLFNLFPDSCINVNVDGFIDKINNIDKYYKYYLPSEINSTICSISQKYKDSQSKKLMDQPKKLIEWIPYSQFINVKEIARGGFGIIYCATRDQKSVILKKFKNSQDTSRYFLNELKSNQNCYEIKHHIIRVHGITKDPKLGEYMLVMQYASGGDLHNWLQKEFADITWNKKKLAILWQISEGLETIHKADYIHRDFHSGNILYDLSSIKRHQWLIGDLGLSQPADNTSSNNEIYGVIPYVAPEIFRGSAFSKETDVYCMGMIMWELTTGCKPFANVEHDINLIFKILDGERPEITEDTPECYANLMKSCWDPDPKKRPSATEIRKTFGKWFFKNKNIEPFNQAELRRIELLKSGNLGPEFAKKSHPKAIYTSRPLSFFISKCSSINSSQGYSYISEEQGFDIDYIESYTSRSLSVPVTSLGKRNIEELNIKETNNDSGKHVKLVHRNIE
ncbi:kinase-like protein [Rhizophagus irregularis]|nr:kinase-like protein [Rhizophagus irregularis]